MFAQQGHLDSFSVVESHLPYSAHILLNLCLDRSITFFKIS